MVLFSLPPSSMKYQLVHPYYKGDGRNFSVIYMYYADMGDELLVNGDILKTPKGQQLLVNSAERVEDYWETYWVAECRLIEMDGRKGLIPFDPRDAARPDGMLQQIRSGMQSVYVKPRQTGATWLNQTLQSLSKKSDSQS